MLYVKFCDYVIKIRYRFDVLAILPNLHVISSHF